MSTELEHTYSIDGVFRNRDTDIEFRPRSLRSLRCGRSCEPRNNNCGPQFPKCEWHDEEKVPLTFWILESLYIFKYTSIVSIYSGSDIQVNIVWNIKKTSVDLGNDRKEAKAVAGWGTCGFWLAGRQCGADLIRGWELPQWAWWPHVSPCPNFMFFESNADLLHSVDKLGEYLGSFISFPPH